MQSKSEKVKILATSGAVQVYVTVILFSVFGLVVLLLSDYTEKVSEYKAGNPTYEWPPYSDLGIALLLGAILLGILRAMHKWLPPICDPHLKPELEGKDRVDRLHRHIGFLFRGCYFTLATVVGYLWSRHSDFLPPSMGGIGSVDRSFDGYPYKPTDDYPYARYYLLLELGYHICNTIDHVLDDPKKDFIEMTLHHILAVGLISLAYFLNFIPTSVLIALRSAFSDVFLSFSRSSVDLRYTKLTRCLFVVLLVAWVYSRQYVTFRYLLWDGILQNSVCLNSYGTSILIFMLFSLVTLELYWFTLMIRVAFRMITKGKIEDVNKTEIPQAKPKET